MHTMTCCKCFVQLGIPDIMETEARKYGNFQIMIYCPQGHQQGYGEGELDKERRARQRAEQENARLADSVKVYQREMEHAKKKAIRLAKRAAAGVCPCCNRTVSQMARHMKSKHPDYNVVPLSAAKTA